MLKITCPNNPMHNRFSTTAHVMQDWEVDNDGDFISCIDDCVQTDHGPEKGNSFTCLAIGCGAEAIVEEI